MIRKANETCDKNLQRKKTKHRGEAELRTTCYTKHTKTRKKIEKKERNVEKMSQNFRMSRYKITGGSSRRSNTGMAGGGESRARKRAGAKFMFIILSTC